MSRRAYAIIIAAFFTVSIAYSIRYGYGMLLPEMLPALDISKTQAGTIFAIYFVVYTVFTPVMGSLSDLYNYRFILTVFTAILGLGALLMTSVTGFAQASLFFPLAALGHAACWAPVASLVQKWVPNEKRGMMLSFVSIGIGLGIPVWGTLLPFIVAASGWRAGWLAMGSFAVVVALMNFILVRNPVGFREQMVSVRERAKFILTIYKALLKDKRFWIVGTAYLLVGFNVLVPFTFLPVYAREALHFDYATSTRFVSLIAFFGIAGQLTLGPWSDRMGRVNVLMLCGAIMGIACLGMSFSPNKWWLYGMTSFFGLAYGAVWPVYAAAASDFFPSNQTGSVVGLWTVFLGLGSIVSPVVCGWTIDITGVYTWAFILGLASGLASTLCLARTRAHETYRD
ncbi:MAG: MFS transporter [Desulfobacteraceae bacterium]|nr:MFS transporter [Desulfobacteraceae bacterium]MCF8093751.1 MFS transporter [Desulfobacteraceae bacterium]